LQANSAEIGVPGGELNLMSDANDYAAKEE
jgi:hypothetical protein